MRLSTALTISFAASLCAQQPAPAPDVAPKAAPAAALTAPAPAAQPAITNVEPAPEAARPKMISQRELTAQLQIFLDQQLFSTGHIDGKPGKFVGKALKRWQRAHGLPETGVLDENVPLHTVYPVYTFHTLTKGDLKFVGLLQTKPSEQAKQKFLPYASVTEFLAERYHCSPDFLMRLNPGVKFNQLAPGSEVRVPNVAPFKLEEMPPTGNFPPKPELAARRIEITLAETMLDLYEGEKLLASIPIAPGAPNHPTPKGTWKILGVASMPTFRWDKGVLERGVRTSEFFNLPAGPNNPVGVGWIGLNKPGIGIHGTNNPFSIGSFASHGCMRTANWDISRIAYMVTAGVPVIIK
jgi:lipoprotein-anchoring transpeptidase ErfK/SrfK